MINDTCHVRCEQRSDRVTVSIVIPSSDGDRGGNLARLFDDLRAQSLRELEIILVAGVSPQGRAINMGVKTAIGEFLVILDDDSRAPDRETIQKLVDVLRCHSDVGMVGASIVQPEDATPFQRRVAREFPRFNMPIVNTLTDSDMPCHGCCAFRKDVFDEIGGEPEDIVRGLDPVVRQRLRERGYRIVLAPGLAVSHPVPGTVSELARMFFRNGRGSAYIQRRRPDLVFDTDECVIHRGRSLRTGFVARVARFPLRWLGHLFGGRFIRALGGGLYVAGYLWEWLAAGVKLAGKQQYC